MRQLLLSRPRLCALVRAAMAFTFLFFSGYPMTADAGSAGGGVKPRENLCRGLDDRAFCKKRKIRLRQS